MSSAALRSAADANDQAGLAPSPKDWQKLPLFSVAQEARRSNKGLAETNLLSLSYGEIVRKSIDASKGLLPESFETYQIVEKDDTVFRFTDLQNDKRSLRSARSPERGIITSAYVVATPTRVDPRFFAYLMRSYDTQKVFYGMGGGIRQSLRWDDVRRMEIAVPPSDLQRTIADYLDRETARIDTLVEKQAKLIDTLCERRHALIATTVRQGLDSDAATRSQDLEWLPRIPSHWDAARLKWISMIFAGGTPDREDPRYWTNGTIPWLNSGAVNDWAVTEPSALITEEALARSSAKWIPAKSVVIGLAGQGRTKGTAARLEFLTTCNQSMAAIVPSSRLDYRFLHYWLVANYQSIRSLAGGDKRDGLNLDHIGGIPCPLPPVSEQVAIADYLDRETSRIEQLRINASRFIDLVKERRTSLITAAVTGQIEITTDSFDV